ncbi:MAG: DUF3095 domain-containing protein [Myxococcota bacterium]
MGITEKFYQELEGFRDFSKVCDPLRYHPVPDDWTVLVADVVASTSAIDAGRYKDVNALGVSCIVAAVNACRGTEIPYVFGGDGATILVPPSRLEDAQSALLGVANIAECSFGLDLRVGAVPVRTLLANGHRFGIARLVLSDDVSLAMFSGDGVNVAEEWVKAPNSLFCHDHSEANQALLDGFECRWEPLKSTKGSILSLLVIARDHMVYNQVLGFIEDLGDVDEVRPSKITNLRIDSDLSGFTTEASLITRTASGLRHLLHRTRTLLITSIGRLLLRLRLNFGGFNGRSYLQETVAQTDFRKFDGALRMVLDLDEEQRVELQGYLAARHLDGALCYGAHVSDHALMTCFIQDYMGRHLHFVDGGDGGYALAARQLKAQLKERLDTAA